MTDQIPAIPIVKGRHPAAQIVLGRDADEKEREAAGEIQRYVQKLAGASLEIVTPEQALSVEDAALLLVGDPDSNPLVEQVLQGKYDPKSLKPEGFVIHTGELDGRPSVAISGHSGVATVYAAYALIELLGATFLLSGDVLPPPVDDLSLPATSRVWGAGVLTPGDTALSERSAGRDLGRHPLQEDHRPDGEAANELPRVFRSGIPALGGIPISGRKKPVGRPLHY